jgi:RNA polymerase sigma-70 factor (ECF subfamily)
LLIKKFVALRSAFCATKVLINSQGVELGGRVVASRDVTVPPDVESAVVPDETPPVPDPADLAGLFDRYGSELLRYCARRVGPDHAEDVVADTFLTAHANFRAYDASRSAPLPWLYGIATNLLRRHGRDEVQAYRAFARAGRTVHRGSDDWDRAAERVDAFRARTGLAKALASLSRKQRDVLLLFAVAQLEYDEIAVALGMPVGTVRSTLHRARVKVRSALGADPSRKADR